MDLDIFGKIREKRQFHRCDEAKYVGYMELQFDELGVHSVSKSF